MKRLVSNVYVVTVSTKLVAPISWEQCTSPPPFLCIAYILVTSRPSCLLIESSRTGSRPHPQYGGRLLCMYNTHQHLASYRAPYLGVCIIFLFRYPKVYCTTHLITYRIWLIFSVSGCLSVYQGYLFETVSKKHICNTPSILGQLSLYVEVSV
jgi:hypothetical protein